MVDGYCCSIKIWICVLNKLNTKINNEHNNTENRILQNILYILSLTTKCQNACIRQWAAYVSVVWIMKLWRCGYVMSWMWSTCGSCFYCWPTARQSAFIRSVNIWKNIFHRNVFGSKSNKWYIWWRISLMVACLLAWENKHPFL